MATTIPVTNETIALGSRITREGRKITYRLKVIQQPERARACGSGAKSSADRRPVDPPPIVELSVFEGQNAENDITFPYKANFFLFATLENARTMVQGRLPTPASFPVLTGTPVAGMAYLDRPDQAGYFIFPDLSVRHEGKYRLSFTLYEEVKEQQDMDPENSSAIQVQASGIEAYVSHRLEVKSKPFTVYSAKKFPGLAESTQLSRMVADQGCRVRIRRDVRMRRRENNKGDKDWDDYEDETAKDRARQSATPDNFGQANAPTPQGIMETRPPSANSNHSMIGQPQRRPSLQDMNQGCPQEYAPPMAPQPQAQTNGYHAPPSYGNAPPAPYPNQYPPQQHAPGMMQPPPTPFVTSPPGYSTPSLPQPQQQQPPPQIGQNYGYMQNQGYPTPTYEQPSPMRHDSVDYGPGAQFRRPSIPQPQAQNYPPPNNMMAPYNHVDHSRQPNPMSHPMPSMQPPVPGSNVPHMNNQPLAPLKTEKLEPISPTYTAGGMSASSGDSSYGGQPKYNAPTPQPQLGAKRTFADTFDTKHLNQPLRQGARPTVPSADFSSEYDDNADDFEMPDARAMSYRRADGSQRSRRIPVAQE